MAKEFERGQKSIGRAATIMALIGWRGSKGKWKSGKEWAEYDHDLLRDRLRKENRGYESGRHDEYSGNMSKELNRMADEAAERGDLDEYVDRLREMANTYEKRARGARHKGGRRK